MSYDQIRLPKWDNEFAVESIGWHTHTPQQFANYAVLAVQRAATHGPEAVAQIAPHLFSWATDTRMLRVVWDRLAQYGGRAPGPNGLHYSLLRDREVWSLLRTISRALRDGSYRPQPAKRVDVPKDPLDPERGTRPISLMNVEDRVIQRAIIKLLQPLRDPQFGNLVFGGRPRRNRLHALARLERLAIETGRWVWVAEDIRDAFEHIPRGRLRQVLQGRVPSKELVDVILRMVDNRRKRGVQQGGPLSPLMLNEYLDHFLDRPWSKAESGMPLLRYVDDLLALCRTKKEAKAIWQRLHNRLLAAGMPVKGGDPVRDLRKGESVDWLGFTLSRADGVLAVKIAAKSLSRLYGKLLLAHEQPNSPIRAVAVIEGWLDQLGPCFDFEDRAAVLDRVKQMAESLGFDEMPTRGALRERWRRAHSKWLDLKGFVNAAPAPAAEPWEPEVDADPSTAPF